jgi:hypothetical protein
VVTDCTTISLFDKKTIPLYGYVKKSDEHLSSKVSKSQRSTQT